jgi:hypothetical protein
MRFMLVRSFIERKIASTTQRDRRRADKTLMNNFVKVTLLVSIVGGLGACPSEGGGKDVDHAIDAGADASTSTDAAVMAHDAATADAGAATADPAAAFLGTWNYVSGGGSLVCGDAPPMSLPATGFATFLRGSDADQLIVVDDQGCETPCSVSGNVAVAVPGSTCPDEGVTISVLVYTLTNGVMREQTTVQIDVDGETCTGSGDLSLRRG